MISQYYTDEFGNDGDSDGGAIGEKLFIKQLIDDVYIAIHSIDCPQLEAYSASRHMSQGNQTNYSCATEEVDNIITVRRTISNPVTPNIYGSSLSSPMKLRQTFRFDEDEDEKTVVFGWKDEEEATQKTPSTYYHLAEDDNMNACDGYSDAVSAAAVEVEVEEETEDFSNIDLLSRSSHDQLSRSSVLTNHSVCSRRRSIRRRVMNFEEGERDEEFFLSQPNPRSRSSSISSKGEEEEEEKKEEGDSLFQGFHLSPSFQTPYKNRSVMKVISKMTQESATK